MFTELLQGGLWHTTSAERFESILDAGEISPDPPIPNLQRWGTAKGPSLYPFVRSIGGVSLFDFSGFDESAYNTKYPLSMWKTFVPCFSGWDEAVWIELDRSAIANGFIDGTALLARWRQQNELGRKIMPIIEAAHIGPIPISAFCRAYKFNRHNQELNEILIPGGR